MKAYAYIVASVAPGMVRCQSQVRHEPDIWRFAINHGHAECRSLEGPSTDWCLVQLAGLAMPIHGTYRLDFAALLIIPL